MESSQKSQAEGGASLYADGSLYSPFPSWPQQPLGGEVEEVPLLPIGSHWSGWNPWAGLDLPNRIMAFF